ncbi:Uncharacterised protein [Bordetella pertussis]|nr:Uncharacterised protein [Bordetella pertussis]
MAARAPAATTSSNVARTCAAGTATMARSGRVGVSVIRA